MEALKDNPAPSCLVVVRARPAGESVEVTIWDNGYGVSTENLPWLFERFFASKPNDLGLSLANSRGIIGIIETHGGKLWVENNRGAGATFTFTRPAAEWENK